MALESSKFCHLKPTLRRFAPFVPALKQSDYKHQPQQRSGLCRAQNSKGEAFDELAKRAVEKTVAALMTLSAVFGSCQPAAAVLNSPNASISRTVDAALRRSIPATNLDIKAVQRNLEDISFKLRIPQRKPWQQMTDDITKSTKIIYDESKVLQGVPSGDEARARELIDAIRAGLIKVNAAIEAKDADKVSIRTAAVLQNVAALELIQAPGLAFSIPSSYQTLPRLTGRATVEVSFERSGGSGGFVNKEGGGGRPRAQIVLEVDGYSAPLTAGNFVANVLAGAYDGAVLSIGGETISVTSSKLEGKVLPMEILPLGEFEPIYKTSLDVQNGELPVLPLSIYGAVAMAHPAANVANPDDYAAANEFFVYKFDKASSGLAGLSFEEGTFPVFGYVTEGLEIVPQLQAGDRISTAKLVSGADRLVVPSDIPNAQSG